MHMRKRAPQAKASYPAWLLPPFPQEAHRTLRLPRFIARIKFSMKEKCVHIDMALHITCPTLVTGDDTALPQCTFIPLQIQALGRHRRQHRLHRRVRRRRRIFCGGPQRKLSLEGSATRGGILGSRERTQLHSGRPARRRERAAEMQSGMTSSSCMKIECTTCSADQIATEGEGRWSGEKEKHLIFACGQRVKASLSAALATMYTTAIARSIISLLRRHVRGTTVIYKRSSPQVIWVALGQS